VRRRRREEEEEEKEEDGACQRLQWRRDKRKRARQKPAAVSVLTSF
jgi:hypothetical protein